VKRYEGLFILNTAGKEEGVKEALDKISAEITAVGGKVETFEAIKPLLLDIGPKATHVGGNGLALSMKIALNLNIGVQLLGFSEGILLAEKSGIDRKVAVEVFTNSALASPMLQL